MTPTRPYFVRAIYEWILDNNSTPYLAVNADLPNVKVPTEHVVDGKIILNLAPEAIKNLLISNQCIEFNARFSGLTRDIFVPMESVLGLYAKENGQGMAFSIDEYQFNINPDEEPPRPSGRPSLKVVK